MTTAKELIEILSKYQPDTRVLVYDPDSCLSCEPEVGLTNRFTAVDWNDYQVDHIEITLGERAKP